MTYYNPLSKSECQTAVDELKKEGWDVTLNRVNAILSRKTSRYNKCVKWHYQQFREDGSLLSSEHFKTKPEALRHISKNTRPFLIGDRFSVTHVFLIGG